MKNIYLVGFMGTGKTSVGRDLAAKAKRQFVDLDDLIELKEKMTISEIFAKNGEPYFRRAEKQALKEVSREKNFIVATGGGIVIDKDNIKAMKQSGTIICLAAKPQVILERTRSSSCRPLLNVSNARKQIELLLKLRAPYYALADKTIDTSELSVGEVVAKIISIIGIRYAGNLVSDTTVKRYLIPKQSATRSRSNRLSAPYRKKKRKK